MAPTERAPRQSPSVRDAALRRLSNANRLLVAGSVALTGVLTAVAASAFPGRKLTPHGARAGATAAARAQRAREQTREAQSQGSDDSSGSSTLQAPEEAPQSSPSSEEAAPAEEAAPVEESSGSVESEAPAISGGS